MSVKSKVESPPPRRVSRGLRLGQLFGIEIRLDPSVAIIFALVVSALAAGLFPDWHPDWSTPLNWGLGLTAGLVFFASLLAHELAHSLVALRFGIPVPRITLFLFGGVSEMEREPDQPRTELLVALAGPLTSLVLGILFAMLAAALAPPAFAGTFQDDPEAALASLSPAATLFFWLGPINLMLALFNMIPGFPLDGGRVLRAIIWWLTGDIEQATRWAALGGRLLAIGLMLLGLNAILNGNLVQGLWFMLIGWFLLGAASSSYRQLVVDRALQGYRASDLMRRHFETVDPHLSLEEFIDDHLTQSAQQLWPVIDRNQLTGFITLVEVKAFPVERRPRLRVADVMRTDLDSLSIPPELSAADALLRLAQHHSPMAVVRQGRVEGLLADADITRWLVLHPAPAAGTTPRS